MPCRKYVQCTLGLVGSQFSMVRVPVGITDHPVTGLSTKNTCSLNSCKYNNRYIGYIYKYNNRYINLLTLNQSKMSTTFESRILIVRVLPF